MKYIWFKSNDLEFIIVPFWNEYIMMIGMAKHDKTIFDCKCHLQYCIQAENM